MVSFDNVKESELKKLKKLGFEFVKTKSKTETARMKGLSTLVLYKNGKLLLQGSKPGVEETIKLIEFFGLNKMKKGFSGMAVGTDEALKGDTFGGIVVAGFKADDDIRPELEKIGVRDSKQLLNPDVVKIAEDLLAKFPENCYIESIEPKEFNKLNSKKNITEILDLLHDKCYRKLVGKNSKIVHIVDLYPGCRVGSIREVKAESKYAEVAAASVLARYGGLKQIRELEGKAGFFIPMGSTHVESGLLELKKKSLKPEDYVKLKFRNVMEFF